MQALIPNRPKSNSGFLNPSKSRRAYFLEAKQTSFLLYAPQEIQQSQSHKDHQSLFPVISLITPLINDSQ
jgi:hypothetical protein